jgi:NADH-quinone oxidoreductase subunit C
MSEDPGFKRDLEARFGEDLTGAELIGPELRATISLSRLEELLEFCRHELRLTYPALLTAYDTGGDLVLVYRLASLEAGHSVSVRAHAPRYAPVAPSSVRLWKGMDWYEREVYDMFGVTFEGHPMLKRILLPDDWTGHPLRKDYVSVPSGDPLAGPQPVDPVGGQD